MNVLRRRRDDRNNRETADEADKEAGSQLTSRGDRWCVPSSVLIGVVFTALAMYYSLSLWAHIYSHRLHGHSMWYAPSDVWMTVDTGRNVWNGSLDFLYHNYYGFFALPLSSLLVAPMAALIDHFNLAEGLFPIAKPSAWLLVGPYTLLFGIFLLDAVRRFAWELGQRRRLYVVQLLATLLVLVPCFEWGHFEDALAVTFTVHAARYALRHEALRAGLLLSLAISTKQWAVMLVPFLILSSPSGVRLRTALAACALPAAMAGFFLIIDFHDSFRAFFDPPSPAPHTGHPAVFVTWFGIQTARIGRATGVLAAAVAGWKLRRASLPATWLAGTGLILLLRPLSEPVNWSYYWSPALLLAGLTGLAAHHRLAARDWVWPSLTMVWVLPHGGTPSAPWWWLIQIVLLALTAHRVAVNCGLDLAAVSRPWRHDATSEAASESMQVAETVTADGSVS